MFFAGQSNTFWLSADKLGRLSFGDFLMIRLIFLIRSTTSVSMRASEASSIHCKRSMADPFSGLSWHWMLLWAIEEVITSNQRERKKCISKCTWQLWMFAKALQRNHSIDAHHEADASHFKLMVDKKGFAMSNCTCTVWAIMCSGNRRRIPFGRVTVSP